MNLDLPRTDTKIEPVIVQQTLDGSAVGRPEPRKSYYKLSIVKFYARILV